VNCKLISLHDTITVNLSLVQCEFHTGKKTVIARIKSINRNLKCRRQVFREYLVPITKGETGICPPANAHAIIDYFISGYTNKASPSNEPKKHF